MKKLNKNNGITLISLVITIVLMLILAGVTIKLVVTDGLFDYASNAVGDTKNAMEQEQELINDIMNNHIKPHTKKDEATTPEAPTLAVTSGTEGNNGWYTSDVTVTITPQSGATKTTYSVSGATETVITGVTNIKITEEGTSTITAYAYNSKGERTASEPLTIKKDSIAPTFEFQVAKIYNGSLKFDWKYRNLSGTSDEIKNTSMSLHYSRNSTNTYVVDIPCVGSSGGGSRLVDW